MRRLIIACGMAICHIVPVQAGARENALNHIAQAMAGAQMCDRIELNTGTIAAIAYVHGVDIARDSQELTTQVRNQMAPFQGQDPELACVGVLMLYGPDGMNVPGLVREK